MSSYSSLTSPRTSDLYPKRIMRSMNAFTSADLPRPGLPKMKTLGLVTGMVSSLIHPIGSQ